MAGEVPEGIAAALAGGDLVPYLGPGMLALAGGARALPGSPQELAALLTARVSVPHKIRANLSAAAQFVENFKHRKTLVAHLRSLFPAPAQPSPLHELLAGLPLPLVVCAWYDGSFAAALAGRRDWGRIQNLSPAEHFGTWNACYGCDGEGCEAQRAADWRTLVYEPIGAAAPAANFIVSDSDFVEVLTEIDIQTPIPERVQQLRRGRGFLFLGCRFDDQLQRSFARQIMKRSGGRHWAVMPGEPTRNEARFLEEQRIERVGISLEEFSRELANRMAEAAA
jgi:hypothetical protein